MIVKCENGHWYDSNVDKSCPHCRRNSEKLSMRLDDIEEDDKTVSFSEAGLSLNEQLGDISENILDINSIPDSGEDNADDDKTISFGFFGMLDVVPVTGWLVCTTGTEKGKDYRLHGGKNFIGRSTSMDVVLIDDKAIAREKHCSVIYEPKENRFYVAPEDGNLTYRNQKVVEEPCSLSVGDVITVGETDLVFIPYCEEDRKWENE